LLPDPLGDNFRLLDHSQFAVKGWEPPMPWYHHYDAAGNSLGLTALIVSIPIFFFSSFSGHWLSNA
jgi:hypothetical protein